MATIPQKIVDYTAPTAATSLEPGDRLGRVEFERRYELNSQLKKAELVEGVVYMPSPVRFYRHGRPHAWLVGWLVQYESLTLGVVSADNATARLDLDNEPQPDVLLMIDPARGGQARISPDDYVEHAPELVVEIASSSSSLDMNAKLHVYRRNGVREYIVWRVLDEAIDWFVLRDGQFVALQPDATGIVRSERFPGLWLHTQALLGGDLAGVLATVQLGCRSSDHAAFVALLEQARKGA